MPRGFDTASANSDLGAVYLKLNRHAMTITRIFRVEIESDLRVEFEGKFNSLSRSMVEKAPGCIQLTLLRPSKWASDKYAMVSVWESESALIAFVGEDWNSSVIPSEMEKYAKNHSVDHFESWE